MTTQRFIPVLVTLICIAAPAHAAQISFESPAAAAGTEFAVPVRITAEGAPLNTVEGLIHIPEGVTVLRIDTTGSAFSLFAEGPSYAPSSRSIEFTAGTPKGISAGTSGLLFTIRARAEIPGTYTFSSEKVTAYEQDGNGTSESVAPLSTIVSVGDAGSVAAAPASSGTPEPLIADIGADGSLFDGQWFATFFGGARSSSVDHYEVREGWWGPITQADRYYILRDQSRQSTLWVTAVSTDGAKTTVMLPAADPSKELLALGLILLVLMGVGVAVMRFLRRKRI